MKNREKLLDEIFEMALQNDMTYFGWTQSVLAALQEKLNVGSKEVFKAGSALAGGVARRGETCGALTGAIMGVCSVVGRERLEDREQYGKALEEADGFVTFLGIKLATRFVNRSIRFAMVRSIVLSALKREKPFTGMVDTAGKDAPRFVGLLPGSPLKSSLISRRSQLNLYPGRFLAHPGEGLGQFQSNIPSSNNDHVLDLLWLSFVDDRTSIKNRI